MNELTAVATPELCYHTFAAVRTIVRTFASAHQSKQLNYPARPPFCYSFMALLIPASSESHDIPFVQIAHLLRKIHMHHRISPDACGVCLLKAGGMNIPDLTQRPILWRT